MDDAGTSFQPESAVAQRYSAAAQEVEPTLCCPVQYDAQLLRVLPNEILERDYGCGDPSRYVCAGETVLDLGSGGGKICYIASQLVGPQGSVIGVDMNDDMLALARKHQADISDRIGWRNVSFLKGRIQDLALDLEALEQHLAQQPVASAAAFLNIEHWCSQQRQTAPLVADNSVDVVLSNCVLNLVTPAARKQLFAEVFRVLRPGGRAVISDIVSDLTVPAVLQLDPVLWSGCISGAFVEGEFLQAFAEAGFQAVEMVQRQAEPWQVISGIEFRSATVRAYKPANWLDESLSEESVATVMYRGPWASVTDEVGQRFERGIPTSLTAAGVARISSPALSSQFVWKSQGLLQLGGLGTANPNCTPGKCC